MSAVDRPARIVAVVALGCTAIIGLFVFMDTTRHLDRGVQDFFWPGHRWGSLQTRADTTANDLSPAHLAMVSLIVAFMVSLVRRRVAPAVFALTTTALASVLVMGSKWGMEHLEFASPAHRDLGAFPSGHMVAAIVFSGQLVLLSRRSTGLFRLLWVPIVALAGLMAVIIQLAALHFITDVLGGMLIAVAVLASASSWRLRQAAVAP